MNIAFQNIFADPVDRSPLSYRGEKCNDNWTTGELIDLKGSHKYSVLNGTPSFCSLNEDSWGDDKSVDAELARHNASRATLIRDNLGNTLKEWNPGHKHYPWVKRISDRGGLVLEVACGWGGGFAPLMLQLNPKATILMNDLGWVLLNEWRKFIDALGAWPNVGLAHFDATKCPLKSDSFDIVDSAGGIANISGSHLAIREAFRILKPGGRLFMMDIDSDPESFVRFPAEVQEQWRKDMKDQDIGKGYEERLKNAGFEILSVKKTGYTLEPDESTLSKLAVKHGFDMKVMGYSIEAAKP